MKTFLEEATRCLLHEGFGPASVTKALEIVGRGLGVDRVYVFEDSTGVGGERLTSQRFEWSAAGVQAQIDNPDLQNLPYSEIVPDWPEFFDRGDVIIGLTREMPRRTREVLEAQQILSILVCPITVHGKCWGFVGFDDCMREREWPSEDVRVLSALARSLSASLRHHSMKRSLDDARAQLRALLEA